MVGAAAPATGQGQNGKAPVIPRSFVAGSRRNDKIDYDSGNVVLTTAEQRLQQYQVAPSGYLRGIYLIVENTAVNTTATTVAYQEDGPFNVLSVVRLLDTNSRPFIGTLTGFDVYILNKYGGYLFQGDAKMSATYSATSGTATTAGTFAFILYLPLELMVRNALGAQLNKSGAAQFSVEMFAAGTGTVFSTAPATSSTLRVRSVLASWLDPESTDAMGNPVEQDPPWLNTTQRWEKQAGLVISAGDRTNRYQGIDGLLRMIISIARRSASTRANGETDWPDPYSLKYEESFLIQSRPRIFFRWAIGVNYGYSAANDAAGGRDSGVFPVWEFIQDFERKPGNELTRGYLPMSSASNLEFSGSWGSAVTLDTLVNKVVPFPQGEIKGLAVHLMTMPQVSDVGKLIILALVVIGMFGVVIAGRAEFLHIAPFLSLVVGFLIGNGKAALNSHAPSPVLVSHVKPNEVVTIEGSYPVERKNVA